MGKIKELLTRIPYFHLWRDALGAFCWVATIIIVAILVGRFFSYLSDSSQQAKSEKLAVLSQVCQAGDLGEPFIRTAGPAGQQQNFCKSAYGRLHRVSFPGADQEPVGGSKEVKEKWQKQAKEACQRVGLNNPRFLVGLGLYCQEPSGALVPVVHPAEESWLMR